MTLTIYPTNLLKKTTISGVFSCHVSDLWKAGDIPKDINFSGKHGTVKFDRGHIEDQYGELEFIEFYSPKEKIKIMVFND
jgi:hypothetical protein